MTLHGPVHGLPEEAKPPLARLRLLASAHHAP